MSYEYGVVKIQLRRDTAAEFASANPVLGAGEPAFETDTNVLKVGDGSTAYNSLSAISGGGGGGISNLVEDTTPQLGGNLDLNSNNITGTGDIDVAGTVTSTDFIGPLNGAIRFTCKMIGSDGKKGQVVYISGLSGDTSEVSLARSDSASTMPAFGILAGNISQNSSGEVVTFGNLRGLDADDFVETGITLAENDVLYVSSSEAGKITNVKPSGQSNLIQNIGKCIRHTPTTNITFKVGGAGRTNDVPNLNEDQFFLGNSSSQAVITDFTDSVLNSLYSAEWTLGANGTSDYTFSGFGLTGAENDPTLYLVRGQRYKFTNNMGAHPFRIQSDPNGSTGTQYNDGITNNDVSNGTLTWDVQFDAPNVLYYQCTSHASMGGKIYIIDENTHPQIAAATSSDNSGRTYIQDISLDSNGHVTGISTATETSVSSDTTGIPGASGITNIVTISQTDYDALGTYDPNTIYFVP